MIAATAKWLSTLSPVDVERSRLRTRSTGLPVIRLAPRGLPIVVPVGEHQRRAARPDNPRASESQRSHQIVNER